MWADKIKRREADWIQIFKLIKRKDQRGFWKFISQLGGPSTGRENTVGGGEGVWLKHVTNLYNTERTNHYHSDNDEWIYDVNHLGSDEDVHVVNLYNAEKTSHYHSDNDEMICDGDHSSSDEDMQEHVRLTTQK